MRMRSGGTPRLHLNCKGSLELDACVPELLVSLGAEEHLVLAVGDARALADARLQHEEGGRCEMCDRHNMRRMRNSTSLT
eukprot:1814247-Pleurochrysis_carterae.AAC.1